MTTRAKVPARARRQDGQVEPIYFWGKITPDGKISSYAALRRDIRNLTVYQRAHGWRIVRLVLDEDRT